MALASSGGGSSGSGSEEPDVSKGATQNAKNVLGEYGKYLAQGGAGADRLAYVIEMIENRTQEDDGLNNNERAWVLAQLAKR